MDKPGNYARPDLHQQSSGGLAEVTTTDAARFDRDFGENPGYFATLLQHDNQQVISTIAPPPQHPQTRLPAWAAAASK